MDRDHNSLNALMDADFKTIKKVYRENRQQFIRYCYKAYGLKTEESKEVYHEAIVRMLYNLQNHKIKEMNTKPINYLIGIGSNIIKKQYNRNKKFQFYTLNEAIEIPEEDFQDENEEWREKIKTLTKEELKKMTEPCKSLLQKFYFYQNNLDQLQEKLQYKNKDTLKAKKSRCLGNLKQKIKERLKKESLKFNQ